MNGRASERRHPVASLVIVQKRSWLIFRYSYVHIVSVSRAKNKKVKKNQQSLGKETVRRHVVALSTCRTNHKRASRRARGAGGDSSRLLLLLVRWRLGFVCFKLRDCVSVLVVVVLVFGVVVFCLKVLPLRTHARPRLVSKMSVCLPFSQSLSTHHQLARRLDGFARTS
jgi:Flp pilus assembly protein TadB